MQGGRKVVQRQSAKEGIDFCFYIRSAGTTFFLFDEVKYEVLKMGSIRRFPNCSPAKLLPLIAPM